MLIMQTNQCLSYFLVGFTPGENLGRYTPVLIAAAVIINQKDHIKMKNGGFIMVCSFIKNSFP
jgi:hypothetical protein